MANDDQRPSEVQAPHSERRTPWVFDVAKIGAAGTVLYVVVRYPIATFYSKLGTDPEEIGFDYTKMLTQISPGIIALLILLAIFYWWMRLIPDEPRMETSLNEHRDIPRPDMSRNTLKQLDDEAFEARMQEAREYWSRSPRDRDIFDTESPVFRKLRELDRDRHKRFPIATWDLRHSFYSDIPAAERTAKHQRGFAWFCALLSLFFFGFIFPGVAGLIADDVRNCGEGLSARGFELGGQHVQLFDSTTQTQRFTDRELLLLGGDAQRYILYDCRNHATLRVPTAGTVLVGSPGEGSLTGWIGG